MLSSSTHRRHVGLIRATLAVVLLLVLAPLASAADLFYWNPSQPLASTDFNRSCNWSLGADGSGRWPASAQDDQFASAPLNTGVWTFHDQIGDGHSSQSLTTNPGRLTLTGRGVDVWNTDYGYAGIWRGDLTGNTFDVTVRVESVSSTSWWGLGGIFAMNNVADPNQGGNILVAITPGNGATMYWCSATNGYFDAYITTPMTAPCYLRLTRNGTTYTGFCRKNLTDPWTQITSATPVGAAPATSSQVMLFIGGNDTANTSTAVFDDFQAGTAMSATDNSLSFAGTGAKADDPCTMTAALTCADIDFTGYTGTFADAGRTLTVATNTTAVSGMTLSATGTLAMANTVTGTITSGGKQWAQLSLAGSAPVTLSDAANIDNLVVATTSAISLDGSPLTIRSGAITRNDGVGTEGLHSITCPIVLGAASVWTNSSSDARLAVSGAVSGAYSLTTQGAGTIELSAGNSYSGGTVVAAGTLLANNASGSGTGSGAVSVAAGATLGGSGSISGVISMANTARLAPGSAAAAVGTLTVTAASPITATATSILAIDVTGASADQLVCSAGSGSLALGNLALALTCTTPSAASYTLISYPSGSITGTFASTSGMPAGSTIVYTSTAVVLTTDGSGANEVWTGAGGDGNWNTNANWADGSFPDSGDHISFPDVTNQAVTMNVAATVGTVTFSAADAYTIGGSSALTLGGTVTQSGAGTVTISAPVATGNAARSWTGAGSGTVTVSGAISGSGLQTFSGATWVLTNTANSFSGGTTISAGTLLVNNSSGSGTGTGNVSVASGATLAGTGSLAGAVTVQNGGILVPGSGGAGTLTVTKDGAGALVLNASSVLNVDLGTASDLVACTGTTAGLTLDGTVNVTGGAGFTATTYTIITYTGALVDNTLAVGTMPVGYTATVDTSVAGQVRLVCSTVGYTARETADADGDGRIDRIRITTTGTLNDDFSGFTATVAGYVVTGVSTGTGANDNEFFVVMTESGAADSAATPLVQVTANTTLRPASGVGTYPTDGAGVTPVDRAKPVLIASTWTDGDGNGVDAGDSITLTFSEPVSTSSMVVADLGLPVSGDSLATSTIANQSTATVAVVLAGTPQLTPAGTYASTSTTAGAASAIYLAVGTRVTDAAGNTGLVQSSATAIDLGPTTAASISIAWETGSDPKSWVVGTVTAGATANTVTAATPPDLRIRNTGNGAVQLLVKTANSAPSAWAPAGAAGSNAYLMKCGESAAVTAAGATLPGSYSIPPLTVNDQTLAGMVYSGTIFDFELYFQAPTPITIGGGLQQTITVTITAQVAP